MPIDYCLRLCETRLTEWLPEPEQCGQSPVKGRIAMPRKAITLAVIALTTSGWTARAEQVSVRLRWDEARTMLAHGEFRAKVRVWQKANASKPLRGRLLGVTEAGIRLARNRAETLIDRDEVRSIRVVPTKGRPWRNRTVAVIAGVPAGIGASLATLYLGCIAVGGCGEGGLSDRDGAVGIVGAGIALPVWICMRARGADRGSILLVLE